MRDLQAYLGTLSEAELAGVLTRRPDATADPVPASIPLLAARLASSPSTALALAQLDAATLALAEVVQGIGDGADAGELVLVGDPGTPDATRADEAFE
ncbi:hypothetical protein [Motilibacter deserti]|uniref:Uncharacterized protein n=1 Tax=Motilibacter deserti TaxID=2714956 RepID=A0ABX0GV38_9ACTN|nr:hypothetical protein [Motilibacter deserti]NHC13674.1 hypothetical protein [Motilibacter deserti]